MLVLIAAAVIGCGTRGGDKHIEKQIEAIADACKDTSKCSVDLKEVAKFEWDSVYVFNSPQTQKNVELAIGTKYPGYVEGERPMIFMNKGNIVYYENNPDGMIKGTPGQVIFSYTVGLKYSVITPEKAQFDIKVEKTNAKTFYKLVAR